MDKDNIKNRITNLAVKSSCAPLLIDFKETLSEMGLVYPEYKEQINYVKVNIESLMSLFEKNVQQDLEQFLNELKEGGYR